MSFNKAGIPNIKNIIEIDFLGGSRRQQLQRVGRLMHSVIEGAQYHLLMSPNQLQIYGKRHTLWIVLETV